MKAEKEDLHHKNHEDSKLAKINALSAEVFEDTKDVQRIQKGLSQQTTKEDSDDEADETVDLKANKKLALELEKKEQKEAKNNKMKAIELEKEEEGLTESSTDEAGSSGRITKILKMLEEEIVARSNKDSDPPVEKPEMPEKPCGDGMSELKKYFSGNEGVKRSHIFLKFAKLLTDGGDTESVAQVPLATAESKPHAQAHAQAPVPPVPAAAPIDQDQDKDQDQDDEPSEHVSLTQKKHKNLKKKYNQKKKKSAVKKQHKKKKPEEDDLVSINAGPKGSKGGISL